MMYPSRVSNPDNNRGNRKFVTLVLGIGIVLFLIACYHAIGFTWDDPFISYRYAVNLANGEGLVFNPGERIEGYSNLLFVLLCAIAYKLGFGSSDLGLLYFGKIIGLLSAIVSISLCFSFLKRWGYLSSIGYRPLALLCPWMLLTNVFFAGWTMGGMETVLFPCLLMVASYILLGEVQKGRAVNTIISLPALVYFLASMTRPEGPLLWFASLLALIGIRKRYSLTWKHIFSYIVTFLILMAVFLLHRFIYFGDIFPNTYYAKATGGYQQFIVGLNNFTSVRSFAHMGNIVLLVCIFIPLCYRSARDTAGFRIMFIQIILYFLFILNAGKDWMGGYRFFVHILPLMACAASMGITALFSREKVFSPGGKPVSISRIWYAVIALLLITPPILLKILPKLHPLQGKIADSVKVDYLIGLGFILFLFLLEYWRDKHVSKPGMSATQRSPAVIMTLIIILLLNINGTGWVPLVPDNRSFLSAEFDEFKSGFTRFPPPMMIEKYLVMGRWMRDNLDNEGYVAIGEAGAIPYLSGNPIVDCYGLMDKTIARMPGTTFFDKSNSPEAADYILGRGPEYFLFKGTLADDGSGINPSWYQFYYIDHIWNHSEFQTHYSLLYQYEDFLLYERVNRD